MTAKTTAASAASGGQQTSPQPDCDPRPLNTPALIQGLMLSSAFPHDTDAVQLVETHISWVLLTGRTAYKVKKPVKLPFLDFSSLSQRLTACQAELRLNRRFAPDLYLEVVPITGTAENPRIGGDGPPIEYAVKMRQFAQDRQLDRLLSAGGLHQQDMEAFGRTLAALHEALPIVSMDQDFGEPAQVHAPLRDSLRDLQQEVPDPSLRFDLQAIAAWAEQRHATLSATFVSRRRSGQVRECHGDLHLANLVRLEQGVVPFDCIEFSADLRWIDLISDAAFLVMDLVERENTELAFVFLNAYLEASGDYDGVRVLHYYLAYRALVRAKVAMIRGRSVPVQQRPRHTAECVAYVRQALNWTQRPRPGLILMHGLAGSGKSYFSRQIAARLPAIRVRSDVERKRMHRILPGARSGSGLATGMYTAAAGEQLYEQLAYLARAIIEGGETALIDATFLDHGNRRKFETLSREIGASLLILDCQAPVAELERRISQRAQQGGDASEADREVLRYQLAHSDPLDASERRRTLRIDTVNAPSIDVLCNECRAGACGEVIVT